MLDRLPGRSPLELRDRAMFELACGSGLRADEIVNLDVADVDQDREEVRVSGKGSKTRIVSAGEAAWQAVGRWLDRGRPALVPEADRPEPALFVSKSGRRLSTSDVRRRLSGATRVGDASISTGQTYTRVESRRLRKAYASAHPRA